jgi:hypothetical protein
MKLTFTVAEELSRGQRAFNRIASRSSGNLTLKGTGIKFTEFKKPSALSIEENNALL